MRIHVDGKGITLAPSLLGESAERLATLNASYEDIVEARVTRRRAGSPQAPHHVTRVTLLLWGRTLWATHMGTSPQDATYAMLDAMARQLQALRRQRPRKYDPAAFPRAPDTRCGHQAWGGTWTRSPPEPTG